MAVTFLRRAGIVSRAYHRKALTPHIDIIAGMDGVVVELLLAGATGWLAGFPNSLPRLSSRLYDAAVAGGVAGVAVGVVLPGHQVSSVVVVESMTSVFLFG